MVSEIDFPHYIFYARAIGALYIFYFFNMFRIGSSFRLSTHHCGCFWSIIKYLIYNASKHFWSVHLRARHSSMLFAAPPFWAHFPMGSPNNLRLQSRSVTILLKNFINTQDTWFTLRYNNLILSLESRRSYRFSRRSYRSYYCYATLHHQHVLIFYQYIFVAIFRCFAQDTWSAWLPFQKTHTQGRHSVKLSHRECTFVVVICMWFAQSFNIVYIEYITSYMLV